MTENEISFILTKEDYLKLEQLNKFQEDIELATFNPTFDLIILQWNQLACSYDSFLKIMGTTYEKLTPLLIELHEVFYDTLEVDGLSEQLKKIIISIYNECDWYISLDDFIIISLIQKEKYILLHKLKTIIGFSEKTKVLEVFYLAFDKLMVWIQAVNIINERINISHELGRKLRNSPKRVVDIHKKGGLARKAIIDAKKEKAYHLFETGKYHSYAECARDIYQKVGVKDPRTISVWLSKKFSKRK